MAISFSPQQSNKDNLNIDILVFFKGKRYKRTAGESVPKEFWNQKTQKASESKDKYPRGIAINRSFKKQKDAAEKACNYFIANVKKPTNTEFWAKVDEILHGVDPNKDNFCFYMEDYINNLVGFRAQSTIKTYRSVLQLIKNFEKHIRHELGFSDIDTDFYDRLKRFMFSGSDRENKYSDNYFGRIIKFIKTIYNDAKNNGIHSLPDLRGFEVINKIADTIYLSTDELMAIYKVPLRRESDKLVRAKFLVGAFTGLRVSDFNNLGNINIGDKFITVTTQKTGQKIIAPINSTVRKILNDRTIDITKKISDQKINLYIKEIARKAGITEQVEIIKHIGGKRERYVYEKCDLVRSHTARRSFATNSFKAGVPTLAIMKITGHTTEKSFLRYIKISQEENANILADHPFFK